MKQKKLKDKAFTLVELLVVIVLLALIATVVVPKFFTGLEEQKRKIARMGIVNIEDALHRFYIDCGRFPDDSEGLEALIIAPPDLEEKWRGAYLKRSQLMDPWDNPYIYVAEGEVNPGSFDLISYGADGEPGGEGDNEDVYND